MNNGTAAEELWWVGAGSHILGVTSICIEKMHHFATWLCTYAALIIWYTARESWNRSLAGTDLS